MGWVRAVLATVSLAVLAVSPGVSFAQDQAASVVLNEYTVYRVSPAAGYFTPGSLIMGWPYKGVLRVEMVCRNKVNVDTDDTILRAQVQQAGLSSTSGWQFDVSGGAAGLLNAEFKGNFVNSVTMSISNVTVYEYSAEDLREVRKQILARPGCAQEIKNTRYRMRDYNGGTAGLFQNQRYVIGDVTYTVNFNKDNPKALELSVQGQITKKFQAKFGLTHLNASASELKGQKLVIGVYPIWKSQW
jgi:hypothetical protein